ARSTSSTNTSTPAPSSFRPPSRCSTTTPPKPWPHASSKRSTASTRKRSASCSTGASASRAAASSGCPQVLLQVFGKLERRHDPIVQSPLGGLPIAPQHAAETLGLEAARSNIQQQFHFPRFKGIARDLPALQFVHQAREPREHELRIGCGLHILLIGADR